jgi:hypothetical protein
MVSAQYAIVNLGREQHPGAGLALDRLQDAFLAGKPGAEQEWTNALAGAVAAAMATEPAAGGCPYQMKEHDLDQGESDGPSLDELLDDIASGKRELIPKKDPAKVQDDEDTTWKPVDLSAVLAGTWTPPQASIGRRSDGVALLYPGQEHAVAAEPEAGKTWLLCQVTADELDDGGRVLYIDFEDDEQEIIGRLLTLGAKPDQLGDMSRFRYVRPAEQIATSDDAYKKIYGRLLDFGQDQGPTLVVLDGVTEGYGMHGWSIDSKRRLAEVAPGVHQAGVAGRGRDPGI